MTCKNVFHERAEGLYKCFSCYCQVGSPFALLQISFCHFFWKPFENILNIYSIIWKHSQGIIFSFYSYRVTVYWIICVQRFCQKTFLNWLCQYLSFLNIFFNRFCSMEKAFVDWLCQYLSFLNIFFNRFCPVEKCGVTPNCLYCDSWTLRLCKFI